MVFVADDLAAWLVALLADAGRKKLTTLVLGSEQERALRQAAMTAIRLTATQFASGAYQVDQLAMVVSEVFREPKPDVALAGQATLLQALQAGIAANLAVLDDASLTGTGWSSAKVLGVAGGVLAETLAGHLMREIMFRGSGGGPLAPLADQLNHDVTHMQGQRIEGVLAHLAVQVKALAPAVSPPAAPGKPVRLPSRPVSLVGRADLLADVDIRLRSGNGPGPRILTLHGMGGAGKTSAAVEYAHRHLGEVGLAWQFPAGDPTALVASFGELADQLRTGEGPEGEDRVAFVHRVLADYEPGWLLVFDNVPAQASVERFLPPAGDGRVLITSRNALWPREQALEVPPLDLEVAARFLVERTGDLDYQAARVLADEMGGLPLALEQAAAYIQAVGKSLTGYMALFRRRRSGLLRRGEPIGYSGTVATAWDLAFTQLQSAPEAVGLLRLLAFCAPEAVPLPLLLQPRPGITEQLSPQVAEMLGPLLEDELAADDAIASLRRYSLVRPDGDGAVSVHRLVQAVTTDQIPAEFAGQWQRAAAALIEAAIPKGSRKPDTWPDFAALLPHAEKALVRGSSGMERIASYLGNSGSYAAARNLQQTVLGRREQTSDPKHPDTLTARHNLAHWTGQAGDPAGALDQSWALLPVIAWVLGAEHPDTLAVRADIAHWTRKGRGRRDHGREHPGTHAVRADRPRSTKHGQRPKRAVAQYETLLPVLERILGPEHLNTLDARRDLAWSTGEAKDTVEARDQFAALQSVVKRVLGPEDPLTLDVRAGLARWTGSKSGVDDAAGARDQFAALLPVYERILGPGHPDTLYIRHSVARWTGQAGDPAGARDLYAALLSERERILGLDHPDTRNARKLLDYWTEKADSEAT
jgi:hypothetical protein